MNRRVFLSSIGISTVAIATDSLGNSSRANAQSSEPDRNVYNSSATAHALAASNAIYRTPSGADWRNVGNSIDAVAIDWRNHNLDAQVSAVCGSIDPNSIKSANMPQDVILQNMQRVEPAFTIGDVQNSLAFIDSQSVSDIQKVISTVQQRGMSGYFRDAIRQASLLATYFDEQYSGGSPAYSRAQPNAIRPSQPPPTGGGGYNCKTDGALVLGFGLAFTTIAIMTMGAGAPLAAGFWITIGTWGSVGASGWGAGHAVACGF